MPPTNSLLQSVKSQWSEIVPAAEFLKTLWNPVKQACQRLEMNSGALAGWYWIYTRLRQDDLRKCEAPAATDDEAVPISQLVSLHDGLPFVIPLPAAGCDWWCVYTGKGINLRQRVQAHFKVNPTGGTGSLSLGRYDDPVSDLKNWGVRILICSEQEDMPFGINLTWSEHHTTIERLWRLQNGWPILCRI